MGPLQARRLAIQFVTDCLSAAEADGYQEHEQSEWHKAGASYGNVLPSSFVVTVGEQRVQFRASILHKKED